MTLPRASVLDLFDEFELAKLAPAVAVTSLQAVAQFQQSPSLISTPFSSLSLFQVKTHSESGVLFYNTGPSSNKDFVALEIWKGLPRLLLDQVTRA